MKDQLAVREMSEIEGYEEQILTTDNTKLKADNRDKAIERIQKRFDASKRVKVGVEKTPDSEIFAK